MDPLPFLQSVAGFVQSQSAGQSANKPILLGTIDPAYAGPPALPKVTFDGESTLSGKFYAHLDSYAPAPGDRVALMPVGTTYLIVGGVSTGGNDAFPNVAGVSAAGVNDTTTSATYVNLAGSTSFSFTKKRTSTQILINMQATCELASFANSAARFGVLINGVDYDVFQLYINQISVRGWYGGEVLVAAGLAAGSYTIQARWRRVSGSATLTRWLNDDWLTVTATEVN